MAFLSNSKLWARWLLPASRRSELGIAKIATMPEWVPVGLMIVLAGSVRLLSARL
jgi:hypothetical protein